MIRLFLRERLSWILFFIGLQGVTLLIAYIDPTLSFASIAYIVFLATLMFIVFLFIRYHKETPFIKGIRDWDSHSNIDDITPGNSPYEQIIESVILQQMQDARKEVDKNRTELEQERDDLTAWIHEVKTPLTAMQLMLDRLEDNKLKSQLQVEWLRIHLLLDSKLHQKRMPFIQNDRYIEATELQPFIYTEIKSLQAWCMQKRIGFDIVLEEKEVLTDGKWLGFMLRQLLTNAIKYSEGTDIHIHSYKKADHTHLTIRDEGRGIDEKDLPRIFDKGFTSTTHHVDQASTGMGLYLTKNIANSLHIKIKVESQPGVGTTFCLTFPRKNDLVHLTGV